MKCNGECSNTNDCKGTVHKVKVTGNGWTKPWFFDYCETAIEIDTEHGFTVEIIDDDTKLPKVISTQKPHEEQ